MRPRTVRLPEDLDRLIGTEANDRNITAGEVIREVLSVHYRIREEDPLLETMVKRLIDEALDERIRSGALRTPEERLHRATDRIRQQEESIRKAPERTPSGADETTHKAPQSTPTPDIIEVLKMIKAHHDRGEEPTVEQIAQEAGIESRPLGTMMRAAGFENQVCRRGGIQARRYTFDLKLKIEELLATGELEK